MWRILEKLALVLLPIVLEEATDALRERRLTEDEKRRIRGDAKPQPANDTVAR